MTLNDLRVLTLIKKLIERFDLNLNHLTVFTELATGPYLYPALIAALANARKVYAISKNSKYGKATDSIKRGLLLADELGVSSKIKFVKKKFRKHLSQCDIITNTGFVRPIRAYHIESFKKTAVIPLMWETWEFRDADIDLYACKQNRILVLGTNEHKEPCNMAPYSGLLAVKLLFDLGLEVYRNRILLLGGQPTLGGSIYKTLVALGAKVKMFSKVQSSGKTYDTLQKYFNRYGSSVDCILVAEHIDRRILIGEDGILSPTDIKKVNPAIRIGIISGGVDAKRLASLNLKYEPKVVRPVGYMSYQPDILGPQPVLELLTAGLKVGQTMANARLSGLDIQATVKYSLKHAPAMDFPGDNSWI
ncbi:hypothetical protein ACFL5W_00630 [Thermodesulfobacteriota bacterium]